MEYELGEMELETLREGYDAQRMLDNAVAVVGGLFEGGKSWTEAFSSDVYQTGRMAARDRERILIALFTGQAERTALMIHVYWGLMEGLEPTEIQQVVLLAGTYTGLGRYTFGMKAVGQTFTRLAELAHALDEPTETNVTMALFA